MSIKVITEPKVYLVGRQQVNHVVLQDFLDAQGAPGFMSDATKAGEELIEVAGRLCYESFKNPRPGGNEKYIGHIVEVGHGSVLEHEVFNFIITGVSRSLTHELVRHRAGFSYSQLSQRYVNESDVAFVVPPAYLGLFNYKDNLAYREWEQSCRDSLLTYKNLIDLSEPNADGTTAGKKQVREAARSVLPNCTETKIFVTANARALRHFCELRGSAHADAEIRRLALALLDILKRESPHVFSDLDVKGGVIDTPNKKV